MIIIGINFGHDAAVAIIRNGIVLAAIEEEKVSRIKQDFGWPRNALHRLLADHEIDPSEVSWAILKAYEQFGVERNGFDDLLDKYSDRFERAEDEYNADYLFHFFCR